MGKLLMMPSKVDTMNQDQPASAAPTSASVGMAADNQSQGIDFTVWLNAPRERTAQYFPVYSAISKALQTSLRGWTQQWLNDNPQSFERKVAAYSLLVFSCTRPFRSRSNNFFTYDIQETATVDQAFRSAGPELREKLDELNTAHRACGLPGVMSILPKKIEDFVSNNRRPIYRMFSVETALMDEVLKFTQINIPKWGLDKAAEELRSAFRKHLHRFTEEFDMADRSDELLSILTDVLLDSEDKETAVLDAA
jgi:hypothetical protein